MRRLDSEATGVQDDAHTPHGKHQADQEQLERVITRDPERRSARHIGLQKTDRPQIARKPRIKRTPQTMGRRVLEIVVYGRLCRIGGTLTLDDLAETEVGDWKMPDFKLACTYAASQGWLIVQNDAFTLTTAGLAAASAKPT
jgi:hypothetical protein